MFTCGPNLFSSPGGTSYGIVNSVRFRASATAYLSETFTGTPQTWTFSAWVKRGTLGSAQTVAGSRYSSGVTASIAFDASDSIVITLNGVAVSTSTAVFRDPSAWLHLVVSVTQSGTSYLYINGTQYNTWTSGATSFLFTSSAGYVNTIGRNGDSSTDYFDGFLANVRFIDGQALAPSYFGTTNSVGVWVPIAYYGTYGTTGFYLKFSDGSSLTNLFLDSSGNGNNWTGNNVSLTAGPTYDWMVDTPTNNYPVLNPLNWIQAAGSGVATLSEANLKVIGPSVLSSGTFYVSTIAATTGKWYAELTLVSVGTANSGIGLLSSALARNYSTNPSVQLSILDTATSSILKNGSAVQTSLAAFSANDVVGMAVDLDAGTLQYYRNGVAYGSQVTSITSASYVIYAYTSRDSLGSTVSVWINFGQRPFSYTKPSGYNTLCTNNL